jgi:dimethylargininase
MDVLSRGEDRPPAVLVCAPQREYTTSGDLARHHLASRADPEKALRQHGRLRLVLEQQGCQVLQVPELRGHPNSVFIKDSALCTPAGYVQLRMGLSSRRGEERWMSSALARLGIPCLGKVDAPGTVEGGDVILTGRVALVGLSARTNQKGLDRLSKVLRSLGYTVRQARVPPPFLHLGGALTVLGPNLVLCCKHQFPAAFLAGFEQVAIAATTFASGNVIALGDARAIVDARNRAVSAALTSRGFKLWVLDLSEFVKGNGGPSCLVLPVPPGASPTGTFIGRGLQA